MPDFVAALHRLSRLPGAWRATVLAAVLMPLPAARAFEASSRAVRADASEGAIDEVLLISTRGLGTCCDADAMADGLRCERLTGDGRRGGPWQSLSWPQTLAQFEAPIPTVVYVHGNRVAAGEDKSHGLQFYRSLAAHKNADAGMRFVIWSWPSTQIRGRVKDYVVKAARTRQVGWQLAWAVDQWPSQTPLAIVGYSYGARVVTGALHLLGGGTMGNLALAERVHAERLPIRAALVAAAVDADWLRPNGYHGRALHQVDSLLLVNNQLDPAMRFYPFSPVGRRTPALGFAGPMGRASLGELAKKIQSFDVTLSVGRHHALAEYLQSTGYVHETLQQIAQLPTAPVEQRDAAIADRHGASGRQ